MYGEWNVYLGPFRPDIKKPMCFLKDLFIRKKVRVIYEDSDHDLLFFFRTKARFLSLIYQ